MSSSPVIAIRLCAKCWEQLPQDAPKRQRFCNSKCSDTALKRRKAGRPQADARPEDDELLALVNRQALELAQLRKQVGSFHKVELERDRQRYAATKAADNADKKISHHGQALEDMRTRLDEVSGQLQMALTELAMAQKELAERRTAPGHSGQRGQAGHERTLTMATQIYLVFFALLGRYKKDRAGVDLTDYDYMLYQHGSDFGSRRKTNTPELDTRTLYYFGMLAKAAAGKAKRTNFQDLQTKNAIRLYNEVVKHVAIPQSIPAQLTKIDLPTEGLDQVQL